jgi:hypothetical protein
MLTSEAPRNEREEKIKVVFICRTLGQGRAAGACAVVKAVTAPRRAVHADSIKTRVEIAYGSSA